MSQLQASNTIELNGVAATADDLRALIATNYGHFTAMRIENGGVRGLDLHLDRLVGATREMFGTELDRERVRGWLRQAIGGETRELSVRINVFSRAFDRSNPANAAAPDVLIAVAAPAPAAESPLRLKSFTFGRELAQIKHVGTFPLFHFRRLAQQAGYDDALFVGADGLVAEASIWNIGFFDGARVIWPQAPQLDGTGKRLLQAGMVRLGVASATHPVMLNELSRFRAAFLTNASSVARPVASIDDVQFELDAALRVTLLRCHETHPLQRP
jgi:branched-subunit amino acid aminotransferase/4-amino-4-deoxychorismate lyase